MSDWHWRAGVSPPEESANYQPRRFDVDLDSGSSLARKRIEPIPRFDSAKTHASASLAVIDQAIGRRPILPSRSERLLNISPVDATLLCAGKDSRVSQCWGERHSLMQDASELFESELKRGN